VTNIFDGSNWSNAISIVNDFNTGGRFYKSAVGYGSINPVSKTVINGVTIITSSITLSSIQIDSVSSISMSDLYGFYSEWKVRLLLGCNF